MPSQSKANIESSENALSKYDWDGNALNRYSWLKHLAKRAYKHDPRFRTHVEYGYHMTGFRTITQSADHSNNLYDRNVTRATSGTTQRASDTGRINRVRPHSRER
eukprot:6376126-Prymnesium_polylepis.1